MTYQDIITHARSELGDVYEGSYAYSDTDMLRYANEGIREAWGVRPSLGYDVETGLLYNETDSIAASLGDLGRVIPLPTPYQDAIIFYVVRGCLLRDVTDENNNTSADVAKTRFNQIIAR